MTQACAIYISVDSDVRCDNIIYVMQKTRPWKQSPRIPGEGDEQLLSNKISYLMMSSWTGLIVIVTTAFLGKLSFS